MRFEESLKLDGDPLEVWKRVSDVEGIPRYWHGTRSLEAIKKEGRTRAKVRFAFGGSGEADILADDARRTLTIDYRSGPFTGEQVVTVGEEAIVARWDVKFRGAMRLASKWNEGHFRSGTIHALERLVRGTGEPAAVKR